MSTGSTSTASCQPKLKK